MTNYKAHLELNRIKSLSAFNVRGYTKRVKVNQHLQYYSFDDGSELAIYARGFGSAILPDLKGIYGENLKINTFGTL